MERKAQNTEVIYSISGFTLIMHFAVTDGWKVCKSIEIKKIWWFWWLALYFVYCKFV